MTREQHLSLAAAPAPSPPSPTTATRTSSPTDPISEPAQGPPLRQVPVLDLHDYAADPVGFRRRWDVAFRDYGFAYLRNHTLAAAYRNLHQQASSFFRTHEKKNFSTGRGYGSGGYVGVGGEDVAASRGVIPKRGGDPKNSAGGDPVESLCAYEPMLGQFPSAESNYAEGDALRDAGRTLWAGATELLRLLMRISAEALGLETAFFDEMYREPQNALRIARYCPRQEEEDDSGRRTSSDHEVEKAPSSQQAQAARTKQEKILYGAHTDYTGFTLLWRSRTNGLQCLDPHERAAVFLEQGDEQWIDVPVLQDNDLVVNAGDLIQLWTGGKWRSNVHRVTRDHASAGTDLMSIVFFTGPNERTPIRTLPLVVGADGRTRVAEEELGFTAGQHLQRKLDRSNVVKRSEEVDGNGTSSNVVTRSEKVDGEGTKEDEDRINVPLREDV